MKKKKRKSQRKGPTERRRKRLQRNLWIILTVLALLLVVLLLIKLFRPAKADIKEEEPEGAKIEAAEPKIDVQLLTVNPYSRPGKPTDKIKGIVVHYTANPGASAMANRNYFEGLKDEQQTKASSNFIIGLEGEVIQCVPTWEIAYASNERNIDTVSIECCHPDETGRFNEETYQSMVRLCAWLCWKFELKEKDVIRHYEVTGKTCPKYFVEDEKAWKMFRKDVGWTLKDFKRDFQSSKTEETLAE